MQTLTTANTEMRTLVDPNLTPEKLIEDLCRNIPVRIVLIDRPGFNLTPEFVQPALDEEDSSPAETLEELNQTSPTSSQAADFIGSSPAFLTESRGRSLETSDLHSNFAEPTYRRKLSPGTSIGETLQSEKLCRVIANRMKTPEMPDDESPDPKRRSQSQTESSGKHRQSGSATKSSLKSVSSNSDAR